MDSIAIFAQISSNLPDAAEHEACKAIGDLL